MIFCFSHSSFLSFQEWVEFSPFEIGIAKYGTFMKTQDFGNKFIVGKKIKHFEEFPLHFLQGNRAQVENCCYNNTIQQK